ncbi:MAG TPA: hypothetical protein PLC59_10825, partial [Bacteroidales bacterium]|nr:hypothetical protein [Bacteroidales bacterium]
KSKEILILKQAYSIANQTNKESIAYLKKTGEPDVWDDLFSIYLKMKARQNKVKTLPQTILDKIDYKYVDYDLEIIEAKKKAAEYFYVHAQTLINKGDKENSRTAYSELLKVKEYYNYYKDTDSLLTVALNNGKTHILFNIENETTILLPADFETELTKISLTDINKLWINYDVAEVEGRTYSYKATLNIKVIDISPEKIKEVHYTDSKQMEDGFTYLLDKNGNVVKDSLGNDIKIPKYTTISCAVIETQQRKSAVVSGTLNMVNTETNQLVKTDPVTAQTFFENSYVVINGNIKALTEESKKKLKNKPLPFPSDPALVLQTAEILKNAVKDIMVRNKYLFD